MRYVWATASHQGRVRGRNEDAVYPESSGSSDHAILVGVADGMGGAIAGNVASTTALGAATDEDPSAEISIVERVVRGNNQLLSKIARNPDLRGMGTTMTLGLFQPDGTLELGHVGDSRAYLVRSDDFELLTTDHTVVTDLVALGHLDPSDAQRHPQRHLLTRALGLGPVHVDHETVELVDGDRVLFCSDGLTTMLSDEQIKEIVAAGNGVEPTVWALVEAANTAGGVDNISVAVVDAHES
ncbi:MAG: serine/threonine-protein phosphatase [Acidobacteria bacterium]|nr:serine/threonine-protein phosphatase [Acidobacteriota bacterium]